MISSVLTEASMPREKHQNGWVKVSGKRVKKWIGHWRPYRPDGTRGHAAIVLGPKSKMSKWEAEDALRKHIAETTALHLKHPAGEPTIENLGAGDEVRRNIGRAPPPDAEVRRREALGPR